MPAPRQLRFSAALVLLLSAAGATIFYATWIGYGGRALTCTVISLAILFAVELFPAAQNVTQTIQRILPTPASWLLAAPIFAAYAFYAIGTGSSSALHWTIVAAYILVPLALLSVRAGQSPGWSDYLALICVALPVKLRWLNQLWPYPDTNLKYAFTVLLAMDVAIVGFIFIRRLDGTGYSLSWSAQSSPNYLRSHRHNRRGRYSRRHLPKISSLGARTRPTEITSNKYCRNFLLHRVARGICLPGNSAEHALAHNQK